jgi:hypothetical protein
MQGSYKWLLLTEQPPLVSGYRKWLNDLQLGKLESEIAGKVRTEKAQSETALRTGRAGNSTKGRETVHDEIPGTVANHPNRSELRSNLGGIDRIHGHCGPSGVWTLARRRFGLIETRP